MISRSRFFPTDSHELLLEVIFGVAPVNSWQQWLADCDLDNINYASYRLLPFVVSTLIAEHPETVPDRVKGFYRFWWTRNQMRLRVARHAVAALHTAAIPTMAFKGVALALDVYPNLGSRPMEDIDIVVQSKDKHRAIECMEELGWKPTFGSTHSNTSKSLTSIHAITFRSDNNVEVDLHWHFAGNSPLRHLADMVWDNSREISMGNTPLFVPCLADQLLLLLLHGTQPSNNPSWHWIPDALVLFRKPETRDASFWERFCNLSDRFRFGTILYDALNYLQNRWQAPVPYNVLKNLARVPPRGIYRREYITRHGQPNSMSNLTTLMVAHARLREHATEDERISLLRFLLNARNLQHAGEIPGFLLGKAGEKLRLRKQKSAKSE